MKKQQTKLFILDEPSGVVEAQTSSVRVVEAQTSSVSTWAQPPLPNPPPFVDEILALAREAMARPRFRMSSVMIRRHIELVKALGGEYKLGGG